MKDAVMQPKNVHTRREALGLGLVLSGCGGAAWAQASAPARNQRPAAGDLLVSAKAGPDAGPLRPDDIAPAGP